MFAMEDQLSPQIHGTRPIHFESIESRPTRRRRTLDPQEVGAPSKMIAPTLLARVEQGHDLACLGVDSIDMIIFMIIATIAAKGRVAQFGSAAA